MRISSLNLNLNPKQFPAFRDNVHKALEYFSGSPINNKESKVFEACAIALGVTNSDRLAAALKAENLRQGDALTAVIAGLCPFTLEPLDDNGCHTCGTKVRIQQGMLYVESLPRAMPMSEQLLWAARQPDDKVRILGQTPSVFCPVEPEGPEPHWHAMLAGYREQLTDWFMSHADTKVVTVGYWHTQSEHLQHLSLAEQMANESHYELILNSSEDGYGQSLTLYRIFKLGDNWHLSRDMDVVIGLYDPNDYHGAPGTTLMIDKIIQTLMEVGVRQPNRLMSASEGKLNTVALNNMAENAMEALICSEATRSGFAARHGQSHGSLSAKLAGMAKAMQETFAMGDSAFVPDGEQPWVAHPMSN